MSATGRHKLLIVSRRPRRGAVFVTALWVTILLTAMVLVMCRSMRVEATASANRATKAQADAIERGVEQYVLCQVDGCNGDATMVTACPAQGMALGGGYFWILRPWPDNYQQQGYGITDEGGKVNLNATWLKDTQLQNLPNLDQTIADAIIDWRDSDSTPSGTNGAENDYYNTLSDFPYNAKNADFESVEELLLVRDVTKDLLFGQDLNRDGVVTPAEQNAAGSNGVTFDSQYNDPRGLYPFVTAYSMEATTAADGTAMLNVRTADQSKLQQLLQQKLPSSATTIMGHLRPFLGGTTTGGGTGRGGSTGTGGTGTGGSTVNRFTSIWNFYTASQMKPEEFAALSDYVYFDATTTIVGGTSGASGGGGASAAKAIVGRLNINTASKQALMALPNLTEADADTIVAQRSTGGDLSSIAWLAQTGLAAQKLNDISNDITTRSYVYSADIVAVSGDGRTFKRMMVVVDGRSSPAKIIYRRDLTNYGWPLDPQIRDQLRTGTFNPPNVTQEPAQGQANNGLNSL